MAVISAAKSEESEIGSSPQFY